MNLADLHRKLIAAARAHRPSDRVPLAFEKRVMARLSAWPRPDPWTFWARALWCAAAPCVAIMLLLSVWSFFIANHGEAANDLSQQIDSTMLAAVDQDSDYSW